MSEEQNYYPHEVLMEEKNLSFDKLPQDIQEAVKEFDDFYNEIAAEQKEKEEKGETFELDDKSNKKLMRLSEQSANMIYTWLAEKDEADAAEKEKTDKEAAEKKEKADKEAAEKKEKEEIFNKKAAGLKEQGYSSEKVPADKEIETEEVMNAEDEKVVFWKEKTTTSPPPPPPPKKKKSDFGVGGFRFDV